MFEKLMRNYLTYNSNTSPTKAQHTAHKAMIDRTKRSMIRCVRGFTLKLLLLLFSVKGDTHFTVPQGVKG